MRAPPTLGPGPAGPFEATTATPDLGTTLGGKYAPTASDPQDGDLSGSVKTYLTATNELITLATYVFPRGQTNITHVVTNTFGLTAQQTVTIKVRDTTPPAVTVAAPAEVVVTGPGTVDHTGKVGAAHPCWGLARPQAANLLRRAWQLEARACLGGGAGGVGYPDLRTVGC